jgi:hypothetical protein
MSDAPKTIRKSLLLDTKKILTDIDSLGRGEDLLPGGKNIVPDLPMHALMAEVDDPPSPAMDGFAHISLKKNKLQATADFFPPSPGREPISLEKVERDIASLKISDGIDWEIIKNTIFKCNTELFPIGEVIIAQALPPTDEIPPSIEIEPGFLEKTAVSGQGSGKIDHHELSSFKLVKKDDILAREIPLKPGKDGYDVCGKTLPFKTKTIKFPMPEKNTLRIGGLVRAACDGRLILEESAFSVNEILGVSGDVDYSSGNIRFPGDVYISGGITQGFKVHAGGSIYCSKVMDATLVEAEGDIATGLGIIGRKTGLVKAGGGIKAKFIEYCFIEAAGSVNVKAGCLNSVVQTLGRFITGPSGIVSGGKIFAKNGIEVAQVGTASGPKTEIICGIDYTIQRKLLWIRDKNIALALSLAEMDRIYSGAEGETARIVSVRARIKDSIHRLNEIALMLVNNLDKNDSAEVIVHGNIYPQTYIEICHVSFVVTRIMAYQRLFLDKAGGHIISENLAG